MTMTGSKIMKVSAILVCRRTCVRPHRMGLHHVILLSSARYVHSAHQRLRDSMLCCSSTLCTSTYGDRAVYLRQLCLEDSCLGDGSRLAQHVFQLVRCLRLVARVGVQRVAQQRPVYAPQRAHPDHVCTDSTYSGSTQEPCHVSLRPSPCTEPQRQAAGKSQTCPAWKRG